MCPLHAANLHPKYAGLPEPPFLHSSPTQNADSDVDSPGSEERLEPTCGDLSDLCFLLLHDDTWSTTDTPIKPVDPLVGVGFEQVYGFVERVLVVWLPGRESPELALVP